MKFDGPVMVVSEEHVVLVPGPVATESWIRDYSLRMERGAGILVGDKR